MHKIERLLQTLAPKGVEFRKLGEVCESTNKKTLKISEVSEVKNKGMYPVINSGRDLYGYYHDFNNDGENITIASRGNAGFINYFNEKFFAGGLCYPYKVKDTNELLTKFLYFYLKTNEIQIMENLVFRGSIPALNKADIETLAIPIPPLEVQQEIVKILDAFTELNTELNTELKVRKKQYEYYQNMLLDFKDINQSHKDAKMSAKTYPKRLQTLLQTLAPKGVEFRKLGEVCESTNKKTLKISEVSEVKNKGMYPVINSGRDLYGYYHDFNNDGENITIASRGNAGFINYFNEKFFAGGLCYPYKVKDTNELLTKFLYFYLKTNEIQIMENLVFRGSIPALNKADIETLAIPIPPLEVQQEIVKILDAFTELNTELNTELKVRKKQYEYYREKLLAFKPLTPHKEVKKC
ncbi:restriction endonuclease subunit S [Helicobacter pylori]|uniref:restriction endonuclease subunit S n=1 Tax=Helicobacter pylori TaxID=210 RepID=UPI001FD1673E|nr:restriction endonuclease subunit S [Helicobacter pylori]UOR22802.1 restriction endonuclease subunit S [Helicobacter pylori]